MKSIILFFFLTTLMFSGCFKDFHSEINQQNCNISYKKYFNKKWESNLNNFYTYTNIKWINFDDYIGVNDLDKNYLQVYDKNTGKLVSVFYEFGNFYGKNYIFKNRFFISTSGKILFEYDPKSGKIIKHIFEGYIEEVCFNKDVALICIDDETNKNLNYILFNLLTYDKQTINVDSYKENNKSQFIHNLYLYYPESGEKIAYSLIKNDTNYQNDLYRLNSDNTKTFLKSYNDLPQNFLTYKNELYFVGNKQIDCLNPENFQIKFTIPYNTYIFPEFTKFQDDRLIIKDRYEVIAIDIIKKQIIWSEMFTSYPTFYDFDQIYFFKEYLLVNFNENGFSLFSIDDGRYYCEKCNSNYFMNGLSNFSDGDFVYTLSYDKKLKKYGEK